MVSGKGSPTRKVAIPSHYLTDPRDNPNLQGLFFLPCRLPRDAECERRRAAPRLQLSLLLVDEEKLPRRIGLPLMQLCQAPPWPGDPVIVVDSGHAPPSHILPPQVLPFTFRNRFSTLIGDVATTGDSGSGVFDPDRKCLLGIISGKFRSHTPKGDKEIAKYFVPAGTIATLCRSNLEQVPPDLNRGIP